jgi:hypothetical protein
VAPATSMPCRSAIGQDRGGRHRQVAARWCWAAEGPASEEVAELLGGCGFGPASRGPCGWLLDGVELDPVHQGVVANGPA